MADAAPPLPVVFKKRTKTSNIKKRAATPPSDTSGSEYSSEDESGHRIKRRRKGGITTSSLTQKPQRPGPDLSKSTHYAGDRSATITKLDDATKESHWHHADNATTDAKATTALAAPTDDPNDPALLASANYKGSSAYNNFLSKNPDKKPVGPVKAPTNIRTITVTDFAPDVCKDYKQTGFCGFGDSCKFLHAREDYKQGWQLDKEWEKVTKGKNLQGTVIGSADRSKAAAGEGEGADEDAEEAKLEGIPFACILCQGPYKSPIVTKCGHYFCEACALKRHRTKGGKACAACGTDTGGTFNVAKNLRKLLDKKRERIRKRKEAAREAGEEVSSDDEDEG